MKRPLPFALPAPNLRRGKTRVAGCATALRGVAASCTLLLTFWPYASVHAQAGAVTSAAERALARRASSAALTSAERAALARLWKDLDRKSIAVIERRFGAAIGPDRLREAAKQPATIMDRASFDALLRKRWPHLTAEERAGILGVYYDARPTINGNQIELPLTIAHERMHQLASPQFSKSLGSKVDEGVTEMFAKRIYGDLHLMDLPKVYTSEQRLATMLAARAGEQRLAAAYFRGDIASLRREIDAQLGPGRFDRFTRAAREGDIAAAELALR